MKKLNIRTVLLLLGLCPFVYPFLQWIYQALVDPWPLFDWLVLWSFVYWPTYLVGLVLILVSRTVEKR